MWTLTYPCLKAILAHAGTSDTVTTAPFVGAVVGLLKDHYAPGPGSVYTGDVAIHEADFTGYAHQPLALGKVAQGQGGYVLSDSTATFQWQPTDAAKSQSIYGQFLLGADSVTLLGVEMFNAPIPLPDANHALTVVVIVGLNAYGGYGNSLVSN